MARTARILLVDDDDAFLNLTRTYLEKEDGFSVVAGTTAREGLEQIASGQIDCVVSDYDMPGQNGVEFLESVRADEPDLPFILFTGKGRAEVEEEATNKGATTYLRKYPIPDQYVTLSDQIRNAVGLRTDPPLYRSEGEPTNRGVPDQ